MSIVCCVRSATCWIKIRSFGFLLGATMFLASPFAVAQPDSTFTPDPYYGAASSHEIQLDGPDQDSSAWAAPTNGSGTSLATASTQPVKPGNQVRSLQQDAVWEPPTTPVAPGYDPRNMQHSAIPWQQSQGNPKSPITQPVVSPAAPAVSSQLASPLTPTGSIIREHKSQPVQRPVAGLIKNPYADSSNNDFAAMTPTNTKLIRNPNRSPIIEISAAPQTAPSNKTTVGKATEFVSSLPNKPRFEPAAKQKPPAKPSPSSHVTSTTQTNPTSPRRTFTNPKQIPRPDSGNRIGLGNSTAFEPTRVLAMVGGEPIFVADALLEVNELIEQHMGGAPEDAKAKERKNLIKRILPKLVDQKVLYVGSLESLPDGVDIEAVVDQATSEFDEKALPDILKQAKFKTANEYDAHLRSMGSSLRKKRDAWARDQLTRYFLSEQVNKNEEISHAELLQEYRDNESSYRIPARSKWEQIMVRFDRFNSPAEARKAITELGNQLIYGANLSALAKKSSHGFRASSGGQHDWTSKDALILKKIDKAIFSQPVNELSDIIETRDGFHIVRVVERQDAGFKPFTEAQIEIKQRLKETRRGEAFDKHIAKLRKRIPVEYFTNDDAQVASRQTDLSRE